ncbi:MAG: hypothetical protein R2800_00415 [Flavipsychrobacter sp.]
MKKTFGVIFITIGSLFMLAIISIGMTAISNGRSLIGTTKTVEGKVTGIYDNGNFDIGIRLEGDRGHYYINRGQQRGLSVSEMRARYIGEELVVSYVDQFSILDIKRQVRHVNRIQLGEEMVYDELD